MANVTILVNKNGKEMPFQNGDILVDSSGNPVIPSAAKATHRARFLVSGNIANFSTGAPNTVDGGTVEDGDSLLLVGQTDLSENGLYVASDAGTGSDGVWVRHSDMDTDLEINATINVQITEGGVFKDTLWTLSALGGLTIGVSDLSFTKVVTERKRVTLTGKFFLDGLADLSSSLVFQVPMFKAGSVVAASMASSSARSAGTISALIAKNGSDISNSNLALTINGTDTQFDTGSDVYGASTFSAGDRIGLLASSSGFTPTPVSVDFAIEIEYDD